MPAVVRPRGEFVHQQLTVDDEQLHRQHPDIVECIGDRHRHTDGTIGKFRRHRCRHHREIEDPVDVGVLGNRPCFDVARRRSPDDDTQLGLEGEPFLDHAGDSTELGPRSECLGDTGDRSLALAVVAEPGGLDDRAGIDQRRVDLRVVTLQYLIPADGEPVLDEERLLGDAVLGDAYCCG